MPASDANVQTQDGRSRRFAIAGRPIGAGAPPFVIAELSGNHNGDLDRARRLIDAAAEAGADAVKLQTYTPDTITLDHDGPGFRLEGGLWAGRTLHDLYAEAHTPYAWHAPLFAHARARGIAIFSSVFDETAVDLLQGLDAPAYKIASFEAVDLPLIARTAATGKPLIISTGMASAAEIAAALDTARNSGTGEVALLHCVSAYPASFSDAKLSTIPPPGGRFRLRGGAVRSYAGDGGGGGGGRAGGGGDREARHPGPRRRRPRLVLLARAARTGPTGARLPRRPFRAG